MGCNRFFTCHTQTYTHRTSRFRNAPKHARTFILWWLHFAPFVIYNIFFVGASSDYIKHIIVLDQIFGYFSIIFFQTSRMAQKVKRQQFVANLVQKVCNVGITYCTPKKVPHTFKNAFCTNTHAPSQPTLCLFNRKSSRRLKKLL